MSAVSTLPVHRPSKRDCKPPGRGLDSAVHSLDPRVPAAGHGVPQPFSGREGSPYVLKMSSGEARGLHLFWPKGHLDFIKEEGRVLFKCSFRGPNHTEDMIL